MLLTLMRFVLTMKMKTGTRKKPDLKKAMQMRNFTMAVVTKDHKSGMHFTFKDGAVSSGGGDYPYADARLIWNNSLTAFKVLASQNNYQFGKALMGGLLKSEGDVNLILLFKDITFETMSPAKKHLDK